MAKKSSTPKRQRQAPAPSEPAFGVGLVGSQIMAFQYATPDRDPDDYGSVDSKVNVGFTPRLREELIVINLHVEIILGVSDRVLFLK